MRVLTQAERARGGRALAGGYVEGGGEVERRVKHGWSLTERPPSGKSTHGTIFEMGISRMSVAPLVLSSGISRFTCDFSTTVSIA
jgi:hypothetical protein